MRINTTNVSTPSNYIFLFYIIAMI